MPEESDAGPIQAPTPAAEDAVHEADEPPPVPSLSVAEGSTGEWYFQEETTGQPAGPWSVAQLCARWRRNQINGLTPVWREGLDGWVPLAEARELKEALREAAEEQASRRVNGKEDLSGHPAKRQKRTVLDEVPLTHTYTSEQGVLYVYDTVDCDWKASDVYEALLRQEARAGEEEPEDEEAGEEDEAAAAAPAAEAGALPLDQEQALQELLAEAGAAQPAALPARGGPAARQAAAEAAEAAAAAAAAAAAPPPADVEKEAKRQKRRDYRERKRLKRQAGLFVKAQENPNVYVSGLPPDTTARELEGVMKRAGVLKVDVETGDAKIRVYLDAEGRCKGDALVSYANAASVGLAVEFLNEFELRPQCRICVQQADFEDRDHEAKLSKDQLKEMASMNKKDGGRAKYLAAKNAQREAVSWSGEMDDGTGRRIVVLRHMFSVEEAEREGSEFYVELADEVREECEKIGEVAKVTPLEKHKQGIVCVKFKTSSEAEECIRVMDGRYFAGRTVEASFYDGKTDLRLLGTVKPVGPPPKPEPAEKPATAEAAGQEGPSTVTVAGPEAASGPPAAAAPVAGAAGPVEGPEAPAPAAAAPAAAAGAPAAAAARAEEQAKSWEEWLDNQSSDSDSEMMIRTEE